MKYLGTRLVATTVAPTIVGESWGKFVTAGSSVPHGWGQAARAGVRSLSVTILVIINRAAELVLEEKRIHILYIGFV